MPARRHAALMFFCILAAALALFSRHNSFAFYYHPDESGKASQIIRHKRNFHHPMMMLSTVEAARYVVLPEAARKDPQRIVELGRWLTALVSALAAAALALLAFRTFGAPAGWAAGLLATTNPLLYELAHYFKEDPWLLAGITLVCLALNAYSESATTRRMHLLAAACALAAAGKYLGFALLPIALWLVWSKLEPPQRKSQLARFCATFIGVWLVLNLHFLRSPEMMFQSLRDETTKLAGLTDGVTRNVPHGFYVMTQDLYGGWLLPAISALWLIAAARTPRKITVAEWLLAISALLQFVGYSFVPKAAFRYHLATSMSFAFLTVAGLARLLAAVKERAPLHRVGLVISAALVGIAVHFQIQPLRDLDASLTSDDRARLIAWIRTNLPADAVIAADVDVNLPTPGNWEHAGLPPLPQRLLLEKRVTGNYGTIADVRAKGVTHVAISLRTYGRYLDENRSTKSGSNQTPQRAFYESLLSRGKVLWSSELGRVTYLQPGLKLISIADL